MSHSISVSLIQQRFTVGAVQQNCDKILQLASEAGTELVIFPELTLTGYPPEDLLFRADLMQCVDAALARISGSEIAMYLINWSSVASRW